MPPNKVKVLYIAGVGRSGSTILGDVLGQIEGFLHVGEIENIWNRALISNSLCGCGTVFRECRTWKAVLGEAAGEKGIDYYTRMSHLRKSGIQVHHIPLMFVPSGREWLATHLEGYLDGLKRLYLAIQANTNSTVVVDSSKSVPYGYLLEMIDAIELYMVHLIRDSRGVAFSWQCKKPRVDVSVGTHMLQLGSIKSSLRWATRNMLAEAVGRYMPGRYLALSYESLIDEPRRAVERILELVQEEATSLPFVSERVVELEPCHGIGGNPSRFNVGLVELGLDDRWRKELKFSDLLVVTVLTWPLLLRYGYLGKKAI